MVHRERLTSIHSPPSLDLAISFSSRAPSIRLRFIPPCPRPRCRSNFLPPRFPSASHSHSRLIRLAFNVSPLLVAFFPPRHSLPNPSPNLPLYPPCVSIPGQIHGTPASSPTRDSTTLDYKPAANILSESVRARTQTLIRLILVYTRARDSCWCTIHVRDRSRSAAPAVVEHRSNLGRGSLPSSPLPRLTAPWHDKPSLPPPPPPRTNVDTRFPGVLFPWRTNDVSCRSRDLHPTRTLTRQVVTSRPASLVAP